MSEERNSNGTFKAGCKGGPGRPKQTVEIKELAEKAPKILLRIVENPKANDKVKADILKWAYEQIHGRAKQQIEADVRTPDKLSVTFEGKLEEWSE